MDDLSKLPPDVVKNLENDIRRGAKDFDQAWSNALELVHKVYDVRKVERPLPSMKAAWNQYERLIRFAVDQLSKNRGADGPWRSTFADRPSDKAEYVKF